jgi:transcriptional regulator NrdR family protein
MSRTDDRIIDILNSKREQLEYIRLREECLNSFDRFLDFVNVEDKDGTILKYRDYLNKFEQSEK